jgi:hypothetical protein
MSVLLATVAVVISVPTHLDHSSVAVTVASLSPAMEGHVWIMTNALLTLTVVAKYVPTRRDRLVVAVTVASRWPAMDGHAWRTMSALWEHTTASNVVSTLRVDSDVNAIQGFSSTQIKGHVLVRSTHFLVFLHDGLKLCPYMVRYQ